MSEDDPTIPDAAHEVAGHPVAARPVEREVETGAVEIVSPLSTDGLEPIAQVLGSPRFVIGDPDPERFTVQYFRRVADAHLVAHVHFGPMCQGPPGHAHGGAVAALLDEIMGFACWVEGHAVLAGRISIGYRKPVPLNRWLVAEGWLDGVSGRKVDTRARLVVPAAGVDDGRDVLLSDSDGLFVRVDMARFRSMADGS